MFNSTYSLGSDDDEDSGGHIMAVSHAPSLPISHSSTQSTIPNRTSEGDNMGEMQMDDIQDGGKGPILDSDSDQLEVYLSLCWSAGKLGAAYYDCAVCQIHLLTDIVDVPPEFHILQQVIRMTNPTTVIASTKQDDTFLDVLKQAVAAQAERNTLDTASTSTLTMGANTEILQLVPSADFDIGASRSRLMNISLPGMPQFTTEMDKAIYMTSLVDMNNISLVRALGALLRYLDRKRINVELEAIGVKTPIASLSLFTLQDLMAIDSDTYGALQIFRQEWHPSVYKLGHGGTKEGLSVFGLFNQCRSALGRKEMRLLFLRPTKDLKILQQRQLAIAFFLNSAHMDVMASLKNYLKNIKNVSTIVARMNSRLASIADWQSLYKSVYNAILIADICKLQPQKIDIFRNITTDFTADLILLASNISKIIDFEESASQRRCVVKFGVDERLDEKKRTYNGLPDFMTIVARQELVNLADEITECNVIYLPQLGYLLSIPMTEQMKESKDYSRENLEFIFISNNTVYYKSDYTRAMAAVAKEFNYVQPKINSDNIIHIEQGRHPLQELCVAAFVPNCTLSGGPNGKVKLITGPNASGKSVYLKQVALIVFLTHIGSFVPAKSASICPIDGIYSRIHTLESISVGLSTFMIDLNQMALATRCANSNSLVVIDEFGKGTSVVDGMALLASCLNFWLAKAENSPHVFVSSHIHGVTRCLLESDQLTYQTMEIVKDGEDIIYLYHLTEGQASSSFAANVCRQAGILQDIVQRGHQVTQCITESKPIPLKKDNDKDLFPRYAKIVDDFVALEMTLEGLVEFFSEPRWGNLINEMVDTKDFEKNQEKTPETE